MSGRRKRNWHDTRGKRLMSGVFLKPTTGRIQTGAESDEGGRTYAKDDTRLTDGDGSSNHGTRGIPQDDFTATRWTSRRKDSSSATRRRPARLANGSSRRTERTRSSRRPIADSTRSRFPVAVLSDVTAADVDLSVRFKPVSGRVDQAAGLVWRYQDEDNYYIVRANALEDNVVLYKVENGKRTDLPVKGEGRTYGKKSGGASRASGARCASSRTVRVSRCTSMARSCTKSKTRRSRSRARSASGPRPTP